MPTSALNIRCKLSAEGIRALWHSRPDRHEFRGVIKHYMNKFGVSFATVKWDHLKQARPIARVYIEELSND